MIARCRLAAVALFASVALLAACGKKAEPGATAAAAPPGPVFSVLAGSEVKDLEPAMVAAAAGAGVTLRLQYAGTLDIVERVNAGERFDAVLPASGAYPSLALTDKPLAREKLFYSRVALGIKTAKRDALGWDRKAPTWADVAAAAADGRLRFGMTNPTSSNSGMAALFAVASAGAGKTEDLAASEVDETLIKRFLTGQQLTAGSSGWLAQAFVNAPAALDGMVNYESVILRANAALAAGDRLTLVYPQDGVISADYPLLLLKAGDRARYDKVVAALKAPAFQRVAAAEGFMRPAIADVALAPGLSTAPVAELSFPNRLEVIDAVLMSYQDKWRRPATSIFVLDISGSMKGDRIESMRQALKVLAGAQPESASARYARFQSRERVALVVFDHRVDAPRWIDFGAMPVDAARQQALAFADGLRIRGGTAIYQALLMAQRLAREESAAHPDRSVSIVLLSDGENTDGPSFKDFKQQQQAADRTRIFPILFGEAVPGEMEAVAAMSGGRSFDGRKGSLAQVFKEIRGYQ